MNAYQCRARPPAKVTCLSEYNCADQQISCLDIHIFKATSRQRLVNVIRSIALGGTGLFFTKRQNEAAFKRSCKSKLPVKEGDALEEHLKTHSRLKK